MVSKFSSYNLGLKEEYSTGKFSKSKLLETSAEGKRGELDMATRVLKVESCKRLEVPGKINENPS